MSDKKLHASVSGEGPPVVLLHGLFGMGSNLGGLARALHHSYQVHQLDLPNHGRSFWSPRADVQMMSDAVGAYLSRHFGDQPVALVGHSLGGKVAMQLALSNPQQVQALVAADIAPVEYTGSHANVFDAIAAVQEAAPTKRSAAGVIMEPHVDEPGVVQFLLMSLKRGDDGIYRWRFNAQALREGYSELLKAPSGGSFAGPALSIYGTQSSYVAERGREAMRQFFPQTMFYPIEGTGHWLHAEKPQEFNAQVLNFLDEHSRTANARLSA